jgi:putative FmdB family regulatory protein
MPIYEYQCEKCHHHLEALQKLSDKPLRECPECGKHTLKRLVSAPMFRLAGSGWYETDFKSDKETRRNLAGKDDGPPAEGSSADKPAKTDTKVEAKSGPASTKKSVVVRKPAARAAARPAAKPKPPARKPPAKKTVRKR